MLPRGLRPREPGEARPELPASHRASAVGTVCATLADARPSAERATSSDPELERAARRAGRGDRGPGGVPVPFERAPDEEGACAQMRRVGARGRVPNLFWEAPSEDQLRRHPRFVALPPVDAVAVGTEASYRYVRQGTALWDELHAGRITTGCLKGALGFQEDGAHRRLGLSGRAGTRAPLIGAWRRAGQPVLEHPRAFADAGEEERFNREAVREYNETLARTREEEDDSMCGDEEDEETADANARASPLEHNRVKVKPRAKPKRNAKGKRKKSSKKKTGLGEDAAGEDDSSSFSADRQKRDLACRRAASRGEGGVRMAWGSAQEAGTLATLTLRHPDAIAREVGLCLVDRASIPESWNIGPLPPLGASPDGVIEMDVWFRDPAEERAGAATKSRRRRRVEMVVEAKNSAPFRTVQPGRFVVQDREPHDRPAAYHVPQLMLEMFAANTEAGLLCLQSATRGVSVFYLRRDDEYVRAMLGALSAFHRAYVETGTEPPERMFQRRADYRELLEATQRVANEAILLETIPHARLPGETYDERAFVA